MGPTPVLKHLRWSLDKVADDIGTMEARVLGYCNQVVDPMAKFVEESHLTELTNAHQCHNYKK
jgi:hypothetical protein